MPATAESLPRLDAAALFRAHAGFVANFLHKLGAPEREIDDLVQEVFLVAHRRGGFEQRGTAKPTTWLAEIAFRVHSAKRRSRNRSREDANTEVVSAAGSEQPSVARTVEQRESLSRVQLALESLDMDKRTVFVLFELQGESCTDIAAGLNIPVGTVYSRLHKARKEFRAAHERLLQGPRNQNQGQNTSNKRRTPRPSTSPAL